MRVSYDSDVDAAYIAVVDRLDPGEAAQQVVATPDDTILGEFILDLDREGRLLGVEVLRASRRLRTETLDLAVE